MINTAQKMKFSIKDFFSKCDQIRKKKKKCIPIYTSFFDICSNAINTVHKKI